LRGSEEGPTEKRLAFRSRSWWTAGVCPVPFFLGGSSSDPTPSTKGGRGVQAVAAFFVGASIRWPSPFSGFVDFTVTIAIVTRKNLDSRAGSRPERESRNGPPKALTASEAAESAFARSCAPDESLKSCSGRASGSIWREGVFPTPPQPLCGQGRYPHRHGPLSRSHPASVGPSNANSWSSANFSGQHSVTIVLTGLPDIVQARRPCVTLGCDGLLRAGGNRRLAPNRITQVREREARYGTSFMISSHARCKRIHTLCRRSCRSTTHSA
jgi:hypothetical protein